MDPAILSVAQAGGWLLAVIGLVGTVVPMVPGPPLIWLGAFLWAWADGFETIGWPSLLLMALLTALALVADLWLSGWGARMGGASWRSLLVAAIGSVMGLVVFSIPGLLIGAVLGLVIGEIVRHGGVDGFRSAWRSSGGLMIGWVASLVFQLVVGILLFIAFAGQALGFF